MEVVVEGASSWLVEAGSNFLVGLAFEWEALFVCIHWSLRRSDRFRQSGESSYLGGS